MVSDKKKGFRLINVAGLSFYWRFSETIDIRPKDNFSNKLLVDFGWYDKWLYANDMENKPDDFEPQFITPKFVSQSILFGLNNNWDIQSRNTTIVIVYKNGEFFKSIDT